MPLIQCTRKLLDELKDFDNKDFDNKVVMGNFAALGDWHANLIRIGRRKCVLFINDQTLYSIFVPNLTKIHFKNLATIFFENLVSSLKSEGLIDYVDCMKTEHQDKLQFTKSSNNKVIGSMVDIGRWVGYRIERHGGLENLDCLALNKDLNRIPFKPINYDFAIERLKKKLTSKEVNISVVHEEKSSTPAKNIALEKEIFIFKVTLNDHCGRANGTPWRILAIKNNNSLYSLAAEIVASFNFDLDHCFGFYNSPKGPRDSSEHYELFVDLELEDDGFGGLEVEAKSVKKTKIKTAFTKPQQKMLFLFDYGDNWEFIAELQEMVTTTPNKKYPYLLEEHGQAPMQYPPCE